ncbi:hypothetical protein ACFL7M_16315 [Thermodesulfobacteriota bacterium]
MAKIIKFKKASETVSDSLITSRPWEFRRACWESKYFIQMLRPYWDRLENQHKESLKLPPHFVLKGGMAHTIHGMYSNRNNMEKMREVYYLAGLIDCMINQTNPLLRTDLIRDIYKRITTLKEILNINWYGHMDQVLFHIDFRFYNYHDYSHRLSEVGIMKGLYQLIREETNKMFDILSSEYIFFTPGEGE